MDLDLDPARLLPIGRGGSAWWYHVPTGLELYAMRTPQQVRIETKLQHASRKVLKQTAWTPFEREVVKDAAESVKATSYLTLHPSQMFADLAPFWEGKRGLGWLHDRVAFAPLPTPPLPETVTLPETFVAVHFYARPTWPLMDATMQFAVETVKMISQSHPVVLVGSGLHMDDHADLAIPKLPNVFTLRDCGISVTPQTNLAVMSAVLARSAGCVGTYGGTVQLAGRLGRPAIGFYADWHSTALAHRHLSEALAIQLGLPFVTLRLGDLPTLQAVVPQVVVRNVLEPETTLA
jgi:hypothetical protein